MWLICELGATRICSCPTYQALFIIYKTAGVSKTRSVEWCVIYDLQPHHTGRNSIWTSPLGLRYHPLNTQRTLVTILESNKYDVSYKGCRRNHVYPCLWWLQESGNYEREMTIASSHGACRRFELNIQLLVPTPHCWSAGPTQGCQNGSCFFRHAFYKTSVINDFENLFVN